MPKDHHKGIVAESITCSPPQIKILVQRTHKSYASQEGVEIWQGTSSTGVLMFSANGANKDNQIVTYEVCLSPSVHTFAATDGNNDGWVNGSIFEVTTESGIILLVGTLDRYSRQEWEFYPSYPISATSSSWKYSTTSVNNWSSESYSDAAWTSYKPGSFPVPTTTTRYFRTTASLPTPLSQFGAIEIGIYSKEGFVAYLNGQEVLRRNLPTTGVTSTTTATSQDTDAAFRRITLHYSNSFIKSSIVFAVEVHSLGTNPTSEDFKAFLIPLMGPCVYRSHTGTMDSNHSADWNTQEMDKAWDHDLETYWYFNNVPAYNTYIFNDGRREIINKYSVRNSVWGRGRDPKNWELLGSNDGTNWVLLDTQEDMYFVERRTTLTFELPNQNVAYNMYRLNVKAVYENAEGEIAEIDLYACNTEIAANTLRYPSTSYSFVTSMDTADIKPYVSGYTSFTITPALSAGLSFNTNTGRISGTPTAVSTQLYTISGTYSATNTQQQTTITITVADCPSTSVRINVVKTTAKSGSGGDETWKLINTAGTTLFTQIGTNSENKDTVAETSKFCLPASVYQFVLISQYSEGWAKASSLVVTMYYRTYTYPIARMNIRDKLQETIYINLATIPATEFKSLIAVNPDASWKNQVMTSSTGWTDYSIDSPVSANGAVWFFRQSFTVSSTHLINQGQAFEYRFRARAGAVIYLDGQEIYRANLPDGDINVDTRATEGRGITEDAWWRSVSGSLSSLSVGTHVFSVGIVHKLGYQVHNTDFDGTLRILTDSDKVSHSWRMTNGESSTCWGDGTRATALFDGLYSSSFVAYFNSEYPAPRYGQGTYWEWRAEMINKYCVVSGYDGPQYDPKSWKLQGSKDTITFTDLSVVNNVVFNYRSQAVCFYMPLQTTAYRTYRIEVTDLSVPNPDNDRFVIGQLELYTLDFNKITVPAFGYPTNSITGYIGAQLTSVAPTSEYYYNYEISPALPTGLYLNTGSGNIYGTPTVPATGTYTITAMGPSGTVSTSVLTINIQQCVSPNILFSLTFSGMGSASTQNGFEIKNSAGTTIDQYAKFPGALTQWYASYCQPSDLFELILKDGPNDGWGDGVVTVKDAEGKTLLTATCNYGEAPKSVYINLAYLVTSKTNQWKYSSTSQSVGWNSVTFSDSTWSSSLAGSFTGLTGTTQYYRASFTVNDFSKFAFYELMLTTQAGIVAYLNGKQIYSYNMPATFTSSTYATAQLSTSIVLYTSDSLVFSGLVTGTNVLAIEIHKSEYGSVDTTFDASFILQLQSLNRIVDGVVSTNYPGYISTNYNEGEANAFDGSVNTKYYSLVCGNSTYLQWTYNNNRKEYINYWSASRGNNADRLVENLVLSGSNDNGNTWTQLDKHSSLTWGTFNSAAGTKSWNFYTEIPYNSFRVTMTSSTCKAGYELSEVVFGTKNMYGYCHADGLYTPAVSGENGYRDCESWYSGTYSRPCSNGVWGVESSTCTLNAPLSIQYDAKAYIFFTNKRTSSSTPVVRAALATITVEPALPSGLSIDSKTGVISGKANALFNTTDITVITTNEKGSASTTISISAINSGEMEGWVIAIIVIACIIIVAFIAIIVFFVVNRRKGSKKGNHNKLGKKSTTPVSSKNSSEKKVRI
ncbi:hypothetical protein WA158_004386 [Blastocystis sp. Blastoise]